MQMVPPPFAPLRLRSVAGRNPSKITKQRPASPILPFLPTSRRLCANRWGRLRCTVLLCLMTVS